MKRIGYARVSTLDQNPERQLVDVQIDKLFLDKASGKDTNRPELRNMLDFIREGDTLIVHSMDRLARNLRDLQDLVASITKKGVAIQFIKEGLTFNGEDSAMSTLLLSVMGAFAEFERSLLKERQREGIAIAKAQGKYKGRKKCMNITQIVEARHMFIKRKMSKTKIAEYFGVSRDTIRKVLENQEMEK